MGASAHRLHRRVEYPIVADAVIETLFSDQFYEKDQFEESLCILYHFANL